MLKNRIEKFLILQDLYSCPVKFSLLVKLFGENKLESYLKNSKKYSLQNDWVGSKKSLKNIEKVKISENKIKYARRLSWMFGLIPWIRFCAVSGGVSFGTADDSSDIDIFIVVAKNRLWITRGLEEILFNIVGVRRVMWKGNTKNKLCINFYTAEDNLNLKIKRNFTYLVALEIVMLKSIFRETFYDKVLANNRWVQEFFPGIEIKSSKSKLFLRIPIISNIFDFLDVIAMYMQVGFMKIMGHSMKNSKLERNRIMFFDENSKWESRNRSL